MFNIGMPEMILVFVIALVVFGPRKLPELSRMLGKAVRELRNATDDLRDALQQEPYEQRKDRQELPPRSPEQGKDDLRG